MAVRLAVQVGSIGESIRPVIPSARLPAPSFHEIDVHCRDFLKYTGSLTHSTMPIVNDPPSGWELGDYI